VTGLLVLILLPLLLALLIGVTFYLKRVRYRR